MHIQKLPVMICVAALLGANIQKVQGADTEAQAKARELMRQKMTDLSTQPAGTVTPEPVAAPRPTPAPPMAPVTPVAPPPVVKEMAPAPAPMAPRRGGLTPEQDAQAREALRQTISSLNQGQTPATVSVPTVPAAPVTPVTPQVPQAPLVPQTPVVPQTPQAPVVAAPPLVPENKLNADGEAKVREALRQKKAELDAQEKAAADQAAAQKAAMEQAAKASAPATSSASVAVTPTSAAPVKEKAVKAATAATPTAPSAPAVMASGSKEQRLADLLQLYKTDKISPAEYHEQRAKIVAEP